MSFNSIKFAFENIQSQYICLPCQQIFIKNIQIIHK